LIDLTGIKILIYKDKVNFKTNRKGEVKWMVM